MRLEDFDKIAKKKDYLHENITKALFHDGYGILLVHFIKFFY